MTHGLAKKPGGCLSVSFVCFEDDLVVYDTDQARLEPMHLDQAPHLRQGHQENLGAASLHDRVVSVPLPRLATSASDVAEISDAAKPGARHPIGPELTRLLSMPACHPGVRVTPPLDPALGVVLRHVDAVGSRRVRPETGRPSSVGESEVRRLCQTALLRPLGLRKRLELFERTL